MKPTIQLQHVRAALDLPDFDALAAQRRMIPESRVLRRSTLRPGEARQAAVMVLLFPDGASDLAFVLLRRTENEHDKHSGQISLPGGAQEPGETIEQTALRETREEVGAAGPIELMGRLTSLYIPPSDFDVHPVVGYVPACPAWVPDASEVAEIIECPLEWLLDDGRKVVEEWVIAGQTLRVPWYNVRGHKVWGATAIILSELEHRLRQVTSRE